MKTNILDLSYAQLNQTVTGLGEPAYRSEQLFGWIYQKLASSFEEMSDLPQSFRQKLAATAALSTAEVLQEIVSGDGQTRKVLLRLNDGKTIESTFMSYGKNQKPEANNQEPKTNNQKPGASRERRTVCVSSQVGCPLGCYFCATGQQGFERNLRPAEIIEQVLFFARSAKNEVLQTQKELLQAVTPAPPGVRTRRSVTNVVFMGMGEPLANYDNVWQAVETINSARGMGLGSRQITLSTAGLVPQIRRLAAETLHVELAISLHAADDALRDRLMPVNRHYPLALLIPACRDYFEKTGRRPTFEYALFRGINDSEEAASKLAQLLRGMNCSVNLILGNPTSCQEYRSSSRAQAAAFQQRLNALGIPNSIRVSRGTDIEGGCGQLKSRRISP